MSLISSCTFKWLTRESNVTRLASYLTCWIYTPPSGLHELKEILLGSTHEHSGADESHAPFSVSPQCVTVWLTSERKMYKLLVMKWFVCFGVFFFFAQYESDNEFLLMCGSYFRKHWSKSGVHFRRSQVIFTGSILQWGHGIFSCSQCSDVKQTHLTVKVGFLICILTEIIILVSISCDVIICNYMKRELSQ